MSFDRLMSVMALRNSVFIVDRGNRPGSGGLRVVALAIDRDFHFASICCSGRWISVMAASLFGKWLWFRIVVRT